MPFVIGSRKIPPAFQTIRWSPASHFDGVPAAHAATIGGLVVGACGFFAHRYPIDQFWWGIGGAATIPATVSAVVAGTEIRSAQIHALYGVSRPPFH